MLGRQLSTQYTGNPLSSAGDANGDGYDDILVGSPTAGSLSQGHTYLVFGGADLPARVDLTASDDASGANEGVVVFKGALTGVFLFVRETGRLVRLHRSIECVTNKALVFSCRP